MPKIGNKNQESGVVNSQYITEITERVERNNKEITKLETSLNKLNKQVYKFSLFSVPFSYNEHEPGSILVTSNYYENWEKHKRLLYATWRGTEKNYRVINPLISKTLYILMHIVVITLAIINIINAYSLEFGINRPLACAILYFIMELLCGGASIWYYVIRPCILTKNTIKKEIKSILSRLKILRNENNAYTNIIEAYKISQISPAKQYSDMKSRTIEQLEEIVDDALTTVVANNTDGIYAKYKDILYKSKKLLDLARENGTIVTEISKIYTIFITDINNIITRTSNQDRDMNKTIMDMLSNFEVYIDKKISKAKNQSNILIEDSINALNNAFLEE